MVNHKDVIVFQLYNRPSTLIKLMLYLIYHPIMALIFKRQSGIAGPPG